MDNKEKVKQWNRTYYLKHKKYLNKKNKNYFIANREKVNLQKRQYHHKNKAKINLQKKEYYLKNKEKFKQKARLHYANNKKEKNERMKKYLSKRRKSDILFRLEGVLRCRLNHLIQKKRRTTDSLLSFSTTQLKAHLEKQFFDGMNWENYGELWEIDHKVPCNFYKNEKQLLEHGFRLNNLQPLPSKLNHSKINYVLDIEKNPISNELLLLPETKGVDY